MCRIAGIINPSISTNTIKQMVSEMCQLLKHGGPDDEGIYENEENHLVLGHRRLALIDLSAAGHQPMSYANGRYWITYNGELYNYPEIKEELEKAGYQFITHSDTEVILAAYAAWGTNAFKRFNGMFAFALWDNEKTNIYLVRDAAGIKPMYYAATKEGLAFASEVRGFAPIDYLQQENPHWPVYLLAYGHLPEPVTTKAAIKPLQKGCFLRYQVKTGVWDIEAFKQYHYIEGINDAVTAQQQVAGMLQKAVKRHLISDAPIGVFLSGGLDSSIIARLAGHVQKDLLKTLSIIFEDEAYSEKKYQDLLIKELKCPNWQEILTESEFNDKLPHILQAMDLPGCDGINTWFISRSAKQNGLKAVLSGVGGDELFGGYPSFTRMKRVHALEKIPALLTGAGRYSGIKQLRRLPYLRLGGVKGLYLFLRGQLIPAEIASQLNMPLSQVWQILEALPETDDISRLSPGNQASWIEMNMYMQNQLLRDSDVMSMAHGIEIRVPFLDAEFMQLAMQLSSPVKYGGALPKQLLINSFTDQLPEEIWNRPKMGFTFPFHKWLAKSEFVKDTIYSSDKNAITVYKKFKAGKMHWSQFMALFLLKRKAGTS